ncbi:FtsX-like permease family protein [Aeromicrobium senzhongii]|uniref:FtsX-like permease family protein n=1 Tax=Aeromicrobium senzhongii TaxID=2663859 RepID=A0ABX6SRG7_9ACTN|nr:FtsX-like permease family protein [Aeromicrobium senzhongii]MTB89080.1 FtsX-like permease family protein [Aeromicrobium senzhongii]QNL93651.1 FtsX-like permease family protein [Aeromicrobium senzhongii]
MSIVWSSARAAARVHRASIAGSFAVVVLASALLTATGAWVEAGIRRSQGAVEPGAGELLALATSFAGTTVLIALFLVASTFGQSLRQRRRQFALLRTIGATPGQVRSMVVAEVLLVTAVAVPVGAVPGLLAAPRLTDLVVSSGIVPAGFELGFSLAAPVATVLLLVPAALAAGLLASRQVADGAASAVRQAGVEAPGLGRTRRIVAGVLLISGLVVAGVPFVVAGTLASALGSTSALLLLAAVAVAGSRLVHTVASRTLSLVGGRAGAAPTLALLNARGFSRRLTTAVVPLALLVALGGVQTGFAMTATQAAGEQLRDGLSADLVIEQSGPEDSAAVARTPGVDAVATMTRVPVDVKTDDDEGTPGFLAWESSSVLALSGDTELVDPVVREGSLDDLTGAATIAVSRDALIGGLKGVGDTVDLRMAGDEVRATIVAVYDRGLGFGDFIVAPAAIEGLAASPVTVLSVDGAGSDVTAALERQGLVATSVDDHVQGATEAGADGQRLSDVLLLVLLAFSGLVAANTLVMLTAGRAAEFRLLRRTGATRSQLLAMIATESMVVALTAIVIGVACVLPSLVGAAYGLLGTVVPAVNWPISLGLIGAVLLVSLLPIASGRRLTAGAAV